MEPTGPRLRLLTDLAIGEAGSIRKPGLGFDEYATVLARAALGTPGPFTIGVFGDWGTGKTSLLRMVKERLEAESAATVWFNAWQYEKEEAPIVPLIGTIVTAIERNQGFRERLPALGRKLLRSLRAIAYGFSASTEVSIPGLASVEAGFVAKDMLDREEALTSDPLLDRSLYYHAFDALARVGLPEGERIVVFIDDLDRCFPDQAIRLLESIKLVLSQRGFIFFLGVARPVVEGYLRHRYETQYGLRDFRGAAYLDKIVQLAFPIPPHVERMEAFATELLASVDADSRTALESVVPPIARHLGPNPRALVRYINNLLIDHEIAALVLEEEVPLEVFAVTRCMQLRWRDLFDRLVLDREASEFVLGEDLDAWVADHPGDTSRLARIANEVAGDPGLREFFALEPCRRWLGKHEERERAVMFLRDTKRDAVQDSAAPPGESPARYFTLVVADEAEIGEALVLEAMLRRAEVANHRTGVATTAQLEERLGTTWAAPDRDELRSVLWIGAGMPDLPMPADVWVKRLDPGMTEERLEEHAWAHIRALRRIGSVAFA